jgi:hypothetical protein
MDFIGISPIERRSIRVRVRGGRRRGGYMAQDAFSETVLHVLPFQTARAFSAIVSGGIFGFDRVGDTWRCFACAEQF